MARCPATKPNLLAIRSISVGDTVKAAEAMAARLKASGLPAADIQVQFRPILQFSAGNAILNKGQSRLILRREVARGPARTISALS